MTIRMIAYKGKDAKLAYDINSILCRYRDSGTILSNMNGNFYITLVSMIVRDNIYTVKYTINVFPK